MKNDGFKLMIPGPVEVSPEVLAAMGSPVQPHYGDVWTTLYNDTLALLKQVFNTRGDVFLMVGSGTVAIDGCLGSAFSSGDKLLVGVNGFFGDRLTWIAESYNLQVVKVEGEWGKPLCAADFEAAYRQHPDAKGAAVVHLETSTTVLNPVQEIGPVIRAHGGLFFVDAVSSLGGIPYDLDGWCIDLCASATQKSLGAPPGLAPVAVNPRAWEVIEKNPKKGHGWYNDLAVWRWYAENWGDWHPSPVTMATNNVLALKTALEQLMAEGIEPRMARYRSLALRLRAGLRRLGLEPFTPDDQMSAVLTAAWVPEEIDSHEIVDYLANQYRIKISGGLGALKKRMIRIGTMSPMVSEADVDLTLEAIGKFLETRKA